MKKLAIITPCYSGVVSYRYMLSIVKTLKDISTYEVNFWVMAGNSVLPMARNALVATAMAWGADKILMLDDDVSWEMDAIARVLAPAEHIVAGVYEKKRQETYDAPQMAVSAMPDGLKVGPNGLWEVDGAATGFMRIDRCVFENMKSKCVKLGSYDEPPETEAELYEYFKFGRLYKDNKTFLDGEDYNFCRAARDVGYKTYVDLNIKLGHNCGPLRFSAALPIEKVI